MVARVLHRAALCVFTAELAAAERDHKTKMEQMRVEHEQEIFKLKQENFVLSAKVS